MTKLVLGRQYAFFSLDIVIAVMLVSIMLHSAVLMQSQSLRLNRQLMRIYQSVRQDLNNLEWREYEED